jgi:hypothetical protein
MRQGLRGDVLKLQAKGNYYRLPVGNFRVLFLLAGEVIQVCMLSKIEKKLMSDAAVLQKIEELTKAVCIPRCAASQCPTIGSWQKERCALSFARRV